MWSSILTGKQKKVSQNEFEQLISHSKEHLSVQPYPTPHPHPLLIIYLENNSFFFFAQDFEWIPCRIYPFISIDQLGFFFFYKLRKITARNWFFLQTPNWAGNVFDDTLTMRRVGLGRPLLALTNLFRIITSKLAEFQS